MIFSSINSLFAKIRYHLVDNKFLYLFSVVDALPDLKGDENFNFKIIDADDKFEIAEWINFHNPSNSYDMKCIYRNVGDLKIIICYHERKIVHYFFVFIDIFTSPLAKTNFDMNLVGKHDVYLGSAFTLPEFRNSWVMLYSLSFIKQYLQKIGAEKCYLLISDSTPGAVSFWERVHFKKITSNL